MDIYDVAHDWANRTDNGASASSVNLFFAGGAIYSYGDQFIIAKHVWNDRGAHAVLFTEQTYSRTTSKHVGVVASASSHLNKLFVPDPALSKEQLFDSWHSAIIAIAGHLEQARRPSKYALEIQQLFNQAKCYADFFGYELPPLLVEAGAISTQSEFTEHLLKESALREKAEAKRRKKRLAMQRHKLADWRAFKNNYINTADGFDYLRLNTDTRQIETTQRVEIPLAVGRQFYAVVLATIGQGGCKNCSLKLMDRYDVLEINAKLIQVGCHKISLKEIKSFAKQQGW
jgi:hypothetical protein